MSPSPGPGPTARLRALATRIGPATAVATAVVAPLAARWLAGKTLVWFDTQRLYGPVRGLVDEALRSLRLPLWNPYLGGGMPLLADAIHGVLHPVSLLAAAVGGDGSVDLLIGGYVLLGGLGARALARDLGASQAAAAVAAVTYASSGFVLSMAGNLVFLAGAGGLPLCVAGLRRFAAEPSASHLLYGAGAAALLLLSGDAQALVLAGAVALVLALDVGGWRGALRAAAAGVAGILVAGVQLLPTVAHVPRTVRGAPDWSPVAGVWALEPWRLVDLALPGLGWGPDPYADPIFSALSDPARWPSPSFPMPFSASLFVGLLPLTFAALGAREGRRGRWLGLLALALLWGALGPLLGADRVLGGLPIWRSFRYSEKLAGPLTLVLALLSALGVDAALERRVPRRRILAVAGAAGAVAVAGGVLLVRGLGPELAPLGVDRLLRGGGHLLAAAAGLGGWLLARDRLGRAGGGAALAALVALALWGASPAALNPGDPEARLRAPGPDLRAGPPGPRLATPYLHDVVFGEPGVESMDRAARLHAALGYPAYNVRARIESLNEYSAMSPLRTALIGGEGWTRWPLAPRRFGATHVVVDAPVTERDRALHQVVTSGAVRVEPSPGPYEVWAVPHREWASFPEAVRPVGDADSAVAAAIEAIATGDPTVVVEAPSLFDAAPGRVLAAERGAGRIRIEAESVAASTLVVNDAWWPGWEATIDGAPVTVFRADGLVRAVRWPPGRHVLEMRYRPAEVRAGIGTSVLGLGILAGAALVLRRRRRRDDPVAPTAAGETWDGER